MISSENILNIRRISFVTEFLKKNNFKTALLEDDGDYSLLMFRTPLFIELFDGLNENCLHISFGDTKSALVTQDGSVLNWAYTAGWISESASNNTAFPRNEESDLFLSFGTEKIHNLFFFLKAINFMLPILGSEGFKALEEQDTSSRPSVLITLQPMAYETKKKYLKATAEH
jgi:hypothetical protein